jgi:hypothetical protein
VQGLDAVRRGPQGRAALISWLPRLFDGGAAIGAHIITIQPGNRRIVVGPSPSLELGRNHLSRPRRAQVLVRGLPDDLAWTITVAAKNPIGLGPATAVRVPA